eukprot:7207968-Pyramimonas_sp.AAC.1
MPADATEPPLAGAPGQVDWRRALPTNTPRTRSCPGRHRRARHRVGRPTRQEDCFTDHMIKIITRS